MNNLKVCTELKTYEIDFSNLNTIVYNSFADELWFKCLLQEQYAVGDICKVERRLINGTKINSKNCEIIFFDDIAKLLNSFVAKKGGLIFDQIIKLIDKEKFDSQLQNETLNIFEEISKITYSDFKIEFKWSEPDINKVISLLFATTINKENASFNANSLLEFWLQELNEVVAPTRIVFANNFPTKNENPKMSIIDENNIHNDIIFIYNEEIIKFSLFEIIDFLDMRCGLVNSLEKIENWVFNNLTNTLKVQKYIIDDHNIKDFELVNLIHNRFGIECNYQNNTKLMSEEYKTIISEY